MGDRFHHARHLLRVGAVLALGFVAFLFARSALVPSDFGVYGYYRAGALNDIRALPIAYAGRAACVDCHEDTYDPPEPEDAGSAKHPALTIRLDPAKDNRHSKLRCEACHGPLQKHIDDTEKDVPKVASNGLCLGCHRLLIGRPKDQPQVAPADHKKSDPQKRTECVSCHKPHWPKTDA
jgi:Cytochrome c3